MLALNVCQVKCQASECWTALSGNGCMNQTLGFCRWRRRAPGDGHRSWKEGNILCSFKVVRMGS